MVNANTNFDRVDANAVSMGRFGRPEELADLVAFLASGENGNITGTTILVDGGVVRSVLWPLGSVASSFTRLSLAYGGHPAGPSP